MLLFEQENTNSDVLQIIKQKKQICQQVIFIKTTTKSLRLYHA
jgi:hypothetical protein